MIQPRKRRERCKRRERSSLHALTLLCGLAGLFLSSGANLLDLALRSGPSSLNDVELIAYLSVNDSAMGRLEKRIPTVDSKRYRRQLQHAQPSPGGEIALLCGRTHWPSAFQDEPGYSLAAISPPTDRAPPVFAPVASLIVSR